MPIVSAKKKKISPAHCVPLKAPFLGAVCFELRNAAIRIIKLEWNLIYRNSGRREEEWESKLHPTEVLWQHIQAEGVCFPPFLIHPCPAFGMRPRILISFSGFRKVWITTVTNACECDFLLCFCLFGVFSPQGRRVLQRRHLCTSLESLCWLLAPPQVLCNFCSFFPLLGEKETCGWFWRVNPPKEKLCPWKTLS